MNEKEKKAIELLRYNRLEDFDIQYEKALKIIYNLINKQQKEIKENDEIIDEIILDTKETLGNIGFEVENMWRKIEKIEEKLEE